MQRTADRFRAAIAGGNYWTAEEALAEYRREVDARWSGATSAAERLALKTEVESLLQWARKLTLARKAHAQSKLARLQSQRAYAGPARETNVWQVQG